MSTISSFIGNQIIIYGGIPVFVAGVLGGLLNTLVFLSLQTFRQSSCAFYLTVMSIVDIGQLVFGCLSRILITLSSVDPTVTSLFYCKTRYYFNQVCNGTALTCLCLATIDQYFATCTRPRWQQFCNIKLARRLVISNVIFWILHGIPYIVFYNHVLSPTTKTITCIDTNNIFDQYRIFFIVLVLTGYLPIAIATLFGWMAYHNVQQIAYRTIPLVRRELDKQLTVMVLVQVVINIFTLLPYTTVIALSTNTNITMNPVIRAKLQLAGTVALIMYYIFFAVSII